MIVVIFSTILLLLYSTSGCPKVCKCWEFIGLIDCSHQQLTTVPKFVNMKTQKFYSLSLKDNNLTKIAIEDVLEEVKYLKIIDVSQNPFLSCDSIDTSTRIKVFTDYQYPSSSTSTPLLPSPSISKEQTTETSSELYPSTFRTTTKSSEKSTELSTSTYTTPPPPSPSTQGTTTPTSEKPATATSEKPAEPYPPSTEATTTTTHPHIRFSPNHIVYIYTIIPSLLFIMIAILLVIYVRRWWKRRQSLACNQTDLEMDQLHNDDDDDDDEIIVYSRCKNSQTTV